MSCWDELADQYAQALWDVYTVLGFDTDGNAEPHSSGRDLVQTVVDAAGEFRADYDEACASIDDAVDFRFGKVVAELNDGKPHPEGLLFATPYKGATYAVLVKKLP